MIEKYLKTDGEFSKVLTAINKGEDCSVFGFNFAEKSFMLDYINKPIIYVTNSYDTATKIKQQFESLNKTCDICFSDMFEIQTRLEINEVYVKLVEAMGKLSNNAIDCLVVSPQILLNRLPDVKLFKSRHILFEQDKNYNLKDVCENLIKMGYSRVEMVSSKAEFSLRGDILDVYPINQEMPIRLNFFDDQLELIKTFDPATFLTQDKLEKVLIAPCNIYFIEDVNDTLSQIRNMQKQSLLKLNEEKSAILNNICEDIAIKLENNDVSNIGNFIAPIINAQSNILSYLENGVVVFDDVKQIYDAITEKYVMFEKNINLKIEEGEAFLIHKNFIIDKKDVFSTKSVKLSFQQITTANRIFNPKQVFGFKSSNLTNYYGKYDLLKEELDYYFQYNYNVVIFAKDENCSTYLNRYLNEHGITSVITESNQFTKKVVNIVPKYLFCGCVFVEDKLVVISSTELLGKQEQPKIKHKNKNSVFVMPKENEYVVHETHGIGLCKGVQKLKFGSYEKDYIVIEYDKGDKLYLPTEQVDMISALVSTSKVQKLNKLGGQEFAKTKQKVKSSVKEMAFDLLKLYAEREHSKGFKFEKDDYLTKEFDNAFPYEETEDQMQAIVDVKKDMESDKIMDRLICGDVGYGKTEVALRAIFKAFQSGKQVAFLAPTTILSQQHYNTCFARLSPFMCNVQVLNRFKNASEQKKVLKDLADGKVDVVCGTHRLLSKDVKFKDLGLLILDEEHRFGVQDKEKIKNLKNNIDVLTLSATPIPRTLHMSLSGIRDISLITTPPSGRLPIQSSVAEFSYVLIKEAITRELSRNGQVLIVYNSIEHIYSFTSKIRELVGEDVTFGVTHSQMTEKELELAVVNLYEGKTQVLVSTTLIENGIDLPNANTLIIVDADKLGLSQLYQLKGRVGRSSTLGYAYFLYDRNKVLSEDAYKRLNALMEYNELGSGFKIALKDLEIRGCGNIMGKEQHGHMQKIGYDLYCKLLNQAIREIKGDVVKANREVKIDVALDCFIPNEYIVDSDSRFRIYSNLITIKSEEERIQVLKEIEDVYGVSPHPVSNLSKISLLRFYAQNFGIKRVLINSVNCMLEFYSKEECVNDKLDKAMAKTRKQYSRNLNENASIKIIFNNENVLERVNFVIDLLANAHNS